MLHLQIRGPPVQHQPLDDKINPKDCQVSLGDSGFLQFFKGLFQVTMANPEIVRDT